MIDVGVGPVAGDVTVIANVGRSDMAGRFTRSSGPVMTAGAGADNRNVIDIGICPVTGDMTIITAVGR